MNKVSECMAAVEIRRHRHQPADCGGTMDADELAALTAAAAADPGELQRLLDLARSGEFRDVEWQAEVILVVLVASVFARE